MSKGSIIGLSILGILIFFVVTFAGSLIGINNTCVQQEQTVIAQYNQNKNNYDNYFKKLKETAQVPDMYVDSFKKVYDGIMVGRYGAGGSKAAFQWIKENNPNLDSSMYRQIQEVIEAGRNSFEANQKTLLDKKQVYQTLLGQFPDGYFAKMMGWPKIDLEKYGIVTSEATEVIFETKRSEPISLK